MIIGARVLKVFAVLFVVLAISNFLKPLQIGEDSGFVLFGERLSGTANAIAGPVFGAILLAYAAGIWRLKAYALPLGVAYAAYVLANLVLYSMRMPASEQPSLAFNVVYSIVALGVSWGAAYLLAKNRAALGVRS